ncbi:hypothetical protein [Brevibacillus massiliensis]|uniref:hypothetical protein n=1 Tax=Brevibacillus massiliensis TaxID=1118054 RepID=UPI0003040F29|nr:hypothetical protein [Brevibacillus massiliensis]
MSYVFDTTGLDVLTAGKENGQQAENPAVTVQEDFNVLNVIETGRDDAEGNKVDTGVAVNDKPEGIIAFLTSGTKLPQPIYLNVAVSRIGRVKGSWKGKIPIDQSKAAEVTKIAR